MTKPHGEDAAGQKLDLIGQPLQAGRGTSPGVGITRREESTMPKAESNGVSIDANGARYIVTKGETYPDDHEFEALDITAPNEEQRAQGAAPENKARQAAPETKSKSTKKDSE